MSGPDSSARAVRCWRLPWHFDAGALRAEVAAIEPTRWQQHFNTGDHDGGWSGVSLVSPDGDAARLHAGAEAGRAGRATDLLAQCPALRSVLATLPFTVETARLLRLAPGSHIREHRDPDIGLDEGSVRLHVPITTAPEVEFYVDGARVPMDAGECWYLDLGRPHRVHNGSTAQERVHLVIDCQVDDRLRAMLPSDEVAEQQLHALTQDRPPSSQQRCEAFVARLLDDPAALDALEPLADAAELAARVVELGAAQGLHFHAADVQATMARRRRAWIERHLAGAGIAPPAPAPPPDPSAAAPVSLDGWLPVAAQASGDRLSVELCRIGTHRLVEPFFEDSVATAIRRPFHMLFRRRVDAEMLLQGLGHQPGLPPTGFVFHLSRCGSTLLAQVLAASPRRRVLSEPPPLDAVLRDGPRATDDPQRTRWLHALLGQLGRPAGADERQLYVKFDSWHAWALPQILRAYPEVPWVFLIREPTEIIVSHLRRPGAQMVPGMLGFPLPGLDPVAALTLPREAYCARLLGTLCEAALDALDRAPSRGLVVDYRQLTARLRDTVLPHLGVPASETAPDTPDAAAIDAALRRDAKQPHVEFQPDSAAKQALVTPAVQDAAERWVLPAYRRLLQRTAQGGGVHRA